MMSNTLNIKFFIVQFTLLLALSSAYSQNDTLKVFNFESCTVSFIEMDGLNNIIFENDSINSVIFKETEEFGSELNDLKDVKISDNGAIGLFIGKEQSISYVLLILKNKEFEIVNAGNFVTDYESGSRNFKVSLLTYNTVYKESYDYENEIKIYNENGYIQRFIGGKPFMNRWIANKRKREKK